MTSSSDSEQNEAVSDGARAECWSLPDLTGIEPLSGRSHSRGEERSSQSAYERGVRDGRLAADQEAVCELRIAASALIAAAEHLRHQRDEWETELEDHVVVLALGVAREVLQREMRADPDVLRQRVADAFTEISWKSPTKVRMHPDDLASVQAFFDHNERSAGPNMLEWISDDTIERGGFVVVTPERLVDGTIDTVLSAIQEHLSDD